jgi:hypothetical protein
MSNYDLQNTTQKTKEGASRTPVKEWTRVLRKGKQFLLH